MNKPSPYETVVVLTEGNLSGHITRRTSAKGNAQFSFEIYREFVSDGEARKVMWFHGKHVEPIQRLLGRIHDRLSQEADRALAEARAAQ